MHSQNYPIYGAKWESPDVPELHVHTECMSSRLVISRDDSEFPIDLVLTYNIVLCALGFFSRMECFRMDSHNFRGTSYPSVKYSVWASSPSFFPPPSTLSYILFLPMRKVQDKP